MQLKVFSSTVRGSERRINQDALGQHNRVVSSVAEHHNICEVDLNKTGQLFCVADGIGGHKGGEHASHMAVEHITGGAKNIANVDDLAGLIQCAHRLIISKAPTFNSVGMGTTIAVTMVKSDVILWANVGDTRIYTKSHHGFSQLSTDDTPIGLKSSNIITQCLGGNDLRPISPHIGQIATATTTKIAIFSDGITNFLGDSYLYDALSSNNTNPAKSLCKAAVNSGSYDDCTALIVYINH